MKKMVLLCSVMLVCSGLAGCGLQNHHSSDKEAASISKLKSENSSLKAKKSSSNKTNHHRRSSNSSKNNNASATSQTAKANGANGTQNTTQASGTQQSNANSVVRDKDGRIVYPDGTRGPIPSPYKEGTPEYNQWLASTNESIRVAYNEPALQLGPEPKATNGQ